MHVDVGVNVLHIRMSFLVQTLCGVLLSVIFYVLHTSPEYSTCPCIHIIRDVHCKSL